ncbi:MAG: hypothetical protein IJO22_04955 [Oscillospiraceae bacterium]|nr:hypothetical protein [Oscillospiraceae bacterium]
MKGDKIMEAIGMIDEELIAEAKKPSKRYFGTKKVFALVAAILILMLISVTSAALGWFDDKIININVINEFFDKNEGIDSYILEFDVEIHEDAKENIENYYFPMLFVNEEYNASANSYSGYFYWENTEKKQIFTFSQHSAITFDEYRHSFGEKMKVSKEKFIFCGEEIKCIIFTPEEKENGSIKQIYWSDGYSVFKITAFNCSDEFIEKAMESLEIVEDFSDYGKFKENRYH